MAAEERLAVVEVALGFVQADVAEIKVDVKTLLAANAAAAGVVGFIRTVAPWAAIAIALGAFFAPAGGF